MKKKGVAVLLLSILAILALTGCGVGQNQQSDKQKPSSAASQSKEAVIHEADYKDLFQGIDGCAVFYSDESNEYNIYNRKDYEKRVSPCSTFKIVTTLIGLDNGIIKTEDSKLGYDGTIYARSAWNADVTLKEAFQSSCVWYFRKIIDSAGPETVKKALTQLKYGNCDISEWKGSGLNPLPELNGFWIESSLQISPEEQVKVLADIFGGKTAYSPEAVKILKDIMYVGKYGGVSVYGKTGSGSENGWFTGIAETGEKSYYFAIHLRGEQASGLQAKDIGIQVIKNHYNQQ